METLTDLITTTRSATGAAYTVATTEPTGRRRSRCHGHPAGIRVGLDLGSGGPAVRTVYEAFAAAPARTISGPGSSVTTST